MLDTQKYISIDLIDPNPWQTRKGEDPAHIEELAHSIRNNGLAQVPAGRQMDDRYQLAFGHNRFAAFRLLDTLGIEGYHDFPLNLREMTDEQMAIAAYEENEKRKDLNPVERAYAVQKMLTDFSWTQQQVAEKLRIDRSTVSNLVRMLRMPEDVLKVIEEGMLPVRSAMALLPYYELTPLEASAVEAKYSGECEEFIELARSGVVNSDVIREKISKFLGFLHPEVPKLDLQDESQPIAEPDSITAAKEESRTEETEKPEDDSIHPGSETESIGGSEIPEEDKAFKVNTAYPLSDAKTAPPGDAKPAIAAEKPAEPEPVNNDILFTITWKAGGGVFIGLRKPGEVPVMRFRQTLTAEEAPALMGEMGIQ
ncbi:MAG: chromosome partitioning protein ParB family [Chloroflexi bacterium]|nr:MAG: chromosome partitioning protein ParB family [Chloroflexota bacterium]